jgi:dTDP-4-amino-4,6-dideoxygalactose transaminase
MITATKPFVPDINLYNEKIGQMFKNAWFTNHGPFVMELEQKLAEYFGCNYFLLVTNGTISMQLAIKALGLHSEIITTPFSYVATTAAIAWENCKPVFADISRDTFNIDPSKIEARITKNTTAILATNVFGYPCDFEGIEAIAKKHHLKVIYDSAHVFGTKLNGVSIFNRGDLSSVSFHATKLFHSIEGGGIFCESEEVYNKLRLLRNFGHTSPQTFGGLGINAKMNETCAAMGLCNFGYIDEILEKRKAQWLFYKNTITNPNVSFPNYDLKKVEFNYAYFPLVVESETVLLKVMDLLMANDIQTRRYFYPSLNTLNYVEYMPCEISEDITKRIFCLPLYHELSEHDQARICHLINTAC